MKLIKLLIDIQQYFNDEPVKAFQYLNTIAKLNQAYKKECCMVCENKGERKCPICKIIFCKQCWIKEYQNHDCDTLKALVF